MSNLQKELNDAEVDKIKSLLKNIKPGCYELKEIYGDNWQKIDKSKRLILGKKFKKSVINKKFNDVIFDARRADNHAIYFVRFDPNGGE